jgi:hypothetical protein
MQLRGVSGENTAEYTLVEYQISRSEENTLSLPILRPNMRFVVDLDPEELNSILEPTTMTSHSYTLHPRADKLLKLILLVLKSFTRQHLGSSTAWYQYTRYSPASE